MSPRRAHVALAVSDRDRSSFSLLRRARALDVARATGPGGRLGRVTMPRDPCCRAIAFTSGRPSAGLA